MKRRVPKNIVFCIVTYKEQFNKSITFNTLVESFKNSKLSDQINIFIYDNTPAIEVNHYETINLDNKDSSIHLKYFTSKKNIGLARAYNFLANEATKESHEWIVLLDQDTTLPSNFFESYYNTSENYYLQAPKVFSNNIMVSPAIYKNFRTQTIDDNIKSFLPFDNITCINSGLLINLNFFNEIGGYNESLFLDFCDHDFFHKVALDNVKKLGVIDCELHQDFSFNNHTIEQAKFRYKIFIKDLKAYSEKKNTFKLFLRVDLPHVLRLTYKYKSLSFIKYRFFKI